MQSEIVFGKMRWGAGILPVDMIASEGSRAE